MKQDFYQIVCSVGYFAFLPYNVLGKTEKKI